MGPSRLVVIREPNYGRIQPLPDVQGNGKEKRRTPTSEMESNEEVSPEINAGTQDEGQAGPNPGIQDEGQAGSNPDDAAESQPQSSHVVHAGPNLEHTDFEVTNASTQQNPEQMDEEFTTTAYPSIQENLKLPTEDQEDEPNKSNTKAEVQSMVTVPIHQDTSSVLLMTTPVIDLTMSQLVSTTVQAPLPTSTATITSITTTTSLPPPPPHPQQSTADLILVHDVKAITTRSGVAYDGPMIPPTPSPPPKEVERETEVTKDNVQPTSLESTAHVQPSVVQDPIPKPEVAPKPKPKPTIPYPSRLNDQKLREKANNQMLKFLQIFQRLHFDISFADALLHMPKFASAFKSLLSNKENCSNWQIPQLYECLALADLGASINLMPFSVWKQLSLSELTSTRMTLELANRSTVIPNGIAEDVFVKVGKFYFSANFVVVDYNVYPQVPLILGRPFLRTARALIDVHDVACEEYAQEVLGFSDSSTSGNPTPSDPIIASSSPSFTPFEGGDFILEEIKACLSNDSFPPGIDDVDFNPEGDIHLLKNLLNDDPSSNLPPLKNDDLKQVDVTMTKPSIEEPLELELKELLSHLEYAFLEGTDKLPVIISKKIKEEEKAALLKVLKSHKRAIAWKISDVKVIKLLDAGLIYPISDSPWVSPVHCVPKKGGMTVVENEVNELIPIRLVMGWRVCIDYHKLNDATREDHFSLPFMDQMLERTFQRCMMAIFHDMIEETMEVFMDDFLVFGDSFSSCLSHLDKMLKRCEDTNLVLNWEKCHFMVKEGIVLGHKISKSEIEVDRAKVDVIAKLSHPTFVKGV
ncbi:reverse transcriptase domain-containing protein [Tanacetum coccineum]